MILELRVHNFRTLVNATYAFRPRHLLIGRNNSGKTNLCLALAFTKLAASSPMTAAVASMPGGIWDFCNYATQDKERIATFSVTCQVDDGAIKVVYNYDLKINVGDLRPALGQAPQSTVVSEKLTATGDCFAGTILLESDGSNVRLLHETNFRDNQQSDCYVRTKAPPDSTMLAKLYELPTNTNAIAFRNALRGIGYLSFAPDRIRYGWREVRGASTGLDSTGASLAQALYVLKTAQESRYRRVLEIIRRLEPRLVAINYLTGPDQNVVPVVELEGGQNASWASLSDGTLRGLALAYLLAEASLLSQLKGPSPVYIIEEPENSLFVGELRSLLDDVDSLAPGAQFIFTTHSPYFIELFDNELDAVTLLKRQGWHTSNYQLSEQKQKIEEALNSMSLGEMYFREMLG